jgi:spore maturation protein SpmB
LAAHWRALGKKMTEQEATKMAGNLLSSYGENGFEISMPDQASYSMMRRTFQRLGRSTGPDGEFFVIKVFPAGAAFPAHPC